jgi:hypothetical protein
MKHMFIRTEFRTWQQVITPLVCLRNRLLYFGAPICGLKAKNSLFCCCLNRHCYEQQRKEVAGGRDGGSGGADTPKRRDGALKPCLKLVTWRKTSHTSLRSLHKAACHDKHYHNHGIGPSYRLLEQVNAAKEFLVYSVQTYCMMYLPEQMTTTKVRLEVVMAMNIWVVVF